jgi:hypothetical protein
MEMYASAVSSTSGYKESNEIGYISEGREYLRYARARSGLPSLGLPRVKIVGPGVGVS